MNLQNVVDNFIVDRNNIWQLFAKMEAPGGKNMHKPLATTKAFSCAIFYVVFCHGMFDTVEVWKRLNMI